MKNKELYYTPELEDLFPGYEYEGVLYGEYTPMDLPVEDPRTIWEKKVWTPFIDYKDYGEQYLRVPFLKFIRTKYLDREDIESFGWELKHHSVDDWFELKDGVYTHAEFNSFHGNQAYRLFLNYGFHDKRLKISGDFDGGGDYDTSECIFEGECKSINELKKIMKWLKIN